MNIDHIVLWVSDQKRSLDFYVNVVGLDPVRAQEFAEGGAGFPSVRVSKTAIIDLMDNSKAPSVRKFTGGTDGAGGALVNHVLVRLPSRRRWLQQFLAPICGFRPRLL